MPGAEMSDTKLLKEIGKNDRYFFSLFSVFILGLLLLFYKDLTEWMRHSFVPAFTIYIIGTALIAQIQNMLGNRKFLRCKANKKKRCKANEEERCKANKEERFTGLDTWQFTIIVSTHILWFFLLLWYLCSTRV